MIACYIHDDFFFPFQLCMTNATVYEDSGDNSSTYFDTKMIDLFNFDNKCLVYR